MSWGLPFLKSGDVTPCMSAPHVFFPERQQPPSGSGSARERQETEQRSEVRRFCDSCPFLTECSAYAIANEAEGWWANLSPNDRKVIRREHGIVMPRSRPSAGWSDWVARERKQADRKSRTAIWAREGMRENSRQMFQNYNEQLSKQGKVTA